MSTHFTATDVRVELPVGVRAWQAAIAVGGGNAWRYADDVPYAVGAGSISYRPNSWFGLRLEAEAARWWLLRTRRTYQDGQLLPVEPSDSGRVVRPSVFIGLMASVRSPRLH